MLSFNATKFRYEPFPIGYSSNVIPTAQYNNLSQNWPDQSLFSYKPELGNKYSLSEVNNASQYQEFIASNQMWKDFHAYIKSGTFISDTLSFLKTHHIDLGISHSSTSSSKIGRLLKKAEAPLSARWEFSMLPAHEGNILPHTDAAQKLITLVVSMMKPDEWNSEWGGGTDVLRPIPNELAFNHINRYGKFEQMETLETYPFVPNQCVTFIKTFNSWHSVHPMKAPADVKTMRKTLTINIERKS